MTGTGKWSELGVPHLGWECLYVDDLGEPSQICEMCDAQEIRYVHHMHHPNYSEVLEVGCVCAGHMEGSLSRARARERDAKLSSGRQRRWPNLKGWHLSRTGNPTIKKYGYQVTVFRSGNSWSGLIKNETTQTKTFARKLYPTEMAAKLAAFQGIMWLQKKKKDPI